MGHEVDRFGYPTDPTLRQLQSRLGDLAGCFRGSTTQEQRLEFVRKYHKTMKELYRLGWDDALDVDAELPSEYMPEEYMRR